MRLARKVLQCTTDNFISLLTRHCIKFFDTFLLYSLGQKSSLRVDISCHILSQLVHKTVSTVSVSSTSSSPLSSGTSCFAARGLKWSLLLDNCRSLKQCLNTLFSCVAMRSLILASQAASDLARCFPKIMSHYWCTSRNTTTDSVIISGKISLDLFFKIHYFYIYVFSHLGRASRNKTVDNIGHLFSFHFPAPDTYLLNFFPILQSSFCGYKLFSFALQSLWGIACRFSNQVLHGKQSLRWCARKY